MTHARARGLGQRTQERQRSHMAPPAQLHARTRHDAQGNSHVGTQTPTNTNPRRRAPQLRVRACVDLARETNAHTLAWGRDVAAVATPAHGAAAVEVTAVRQVEGTLSRAHRGGEKGRNSGKLVEETHQIQNSSGHVCTHGVQDGS